MSMMSTQLLYSSRKLKGVDDAKTAKRRVEENDVLRRTQIKWDKSRKMMDHHPEN